MEDFLNRTRSLRDDSLAGIAIERRAAVGGMGVVFEGTVLATGRRVAVKMLAGSDAIGHARFAAEAEILEGLATDAVVAYIGHGVTRAGESYLVMEWLEGETLAALLARRGALEVIDAVAIARRIATALGCAHARGIVHRDVKPSNVFLPSGIAADAKLIDFGVARRIDHQLTSTGQLVGTPGYMAPEQALGRRDLDGRVDLFALGCLLHEMVHGQQPFPGDQVVEVLAKVLMREPQPVAGRRVSPRLSSLIAALLAKVPEDRVATASAVEAELATIASAMERGDTAALRREPFRARRVRRARRVIAAAVAAVTAVLVLHDRPERRDPCGDSAAAFDAAWNAQRRRALHDGPARAFAGELEPVLDRYRTDWIAQRESVCRGEQTEATLDLRMRCLEGRRQTFVALVDLLSTSKTRGPRAAGPLLRVSDCAKVATLERIKPVPADPAIRARIDELAAKLETARMRFQMEEFEPALADARAIASEARTLGYRPFEADAGMLQGEIEHRLNLIDTAIDTLQAAVWAAEAGRNDVTAAGGLSRLVWIVGYERGDYARANELARRATAAIARLGGNDGLEGDLEGGLAAIAANQGKLAESIRHFRASIAHLEAHYGPDDPNVTRARENLAIALLSVEEAPAAVDLMTEVLATRERTLDATHPMIGSALLNLGLARIERGDYALAESNLRRALAISEPSLGRTHPEIVEMRSSLARTVALLGRRDEALAIGRTALGLAETAYGPAHLSFATHLVAFAELAAAAGKLRDAERLLVRAETIFANPAWNARTDLARTWVARAELRFRRERWRDAIALYERARPVLETAEGTDEPRARAATHLGIAYLRARRPHRALAILELAQRETRVRPALRGAQDFGLAQALWDTGGDRRRARELATRALEELGTGRDRSTVAAWLARHR